MADANDATCSAHNRTAVVIGGGPAGLVTALGLSQVVHQVVVVERHAAFQARGATFGVMANGRSAIQEISSRLWQRLAEVGIDLPDGAGLMLPWWEMRDAAAAVVEETPNIELIMGDTFDSIVDAGTAVEMELVSGRHLTADLVVGADGVHSAVRDWLGLPAGLETGSTVFRGFLTVNESNSKELQGLLSKGVVPIGAKQLHGVYFMVFNFDSKYPGRLVWVLSTTNEVTDHTTPLSLLQDAGVEGDELRLYREIFEQSDRSYWQPFPSTKVIDFSDKVLAQYDGGWGGRGLVTLVGDAAHAMRPTDGQGGNQAFEDAVVLMRTLERHNGSLVEALRSFEAERLPRVKKIHDDQRVRYERRMAGEQVGPPSQEFRNWILKGV